MADKKDNIDLSDDLDWDLDDDFVLEDDFTDGTENKKDRKPVESMKEGLRQGFKDVGSTDGINNIAEKVMPKKFTSSKEELKSYITEGKQLFDDSLGEINRSVGTLKTQMRKAAAIYERTGAAPKFITDIMKKIAGKEKEREQAEQARLDQEQRNQEEIAGAIDDLAKAQIELQKAAETRQMMREEMEGKRFESQQELLYGIRTSLQRSTDYSEQVATRYYNNQIKISFQQLHTQRAIYQTVLQSAEHQKQALDSLVKNSALPDIVKAQKMEVFKDMALRRTGNFLANRLSDYMGGFKENLINNVNNTLKGVVSGFKSATEMGGMMVESHADGVEMMDSMGMRINPGEAIGKKIASILTTNLARSAIGKADGTGRVSGMAEKLYRLSSQLPTYANRQRDKFASSDNILLNFVGSLIPGYSENAITSNLHGREKLKELAEFDNQTRTSIVDVIPQLLSKIHQSTEAIRSKVAPGQLSDDSRLVWDHNQNKLVRRSRLKNSLRKEVEEASNFKGQIDNAYEILSVIDPSWIIHGSEREAIAREIVESGGKGSGFDPIEWMDTNRKWKNKISDTTKARFIDLVIGNLTGLNKDKYDRSELEKKLRFVNDKSNDIDEYRSKGANLVGHLISSDASYSDMLRELGYATNNGGTVSVDRTGIFNGKNISRYQRKYLSDADTEARYRSKQNHWDDSFYTMKSLSVRDFQNAPGYNKERDKVHNKGYQYLSYGGKKYGEWLSFEEWSEIVQTEEGRARLLGSDIGRIFKTVGGVIRNTANKAASSFADTKVGGVVNQYLDQGKTQVGSALTGLDNHFGISKGFNDFNTVASEIIEDITNDIKHAARVRNANIPFNPNVDSSNINRLSYNDIDWATISVSQNQYHMILRNLLNRQISGGLSENQARKNVFNKVIKKWLTTSTSETTKKAKTSAVQSFDTIKTTAMSAKSNAINIADKQLERLSEYREDPKKFKAIITNAGKFVTAEEWNKVVLPQVGMMANKLSENEYVKLVDDVVKTKIKDFGRAEDKAAFLVSVLSDAGVSLPEQVRDKLTDEAIKLSADKAGTFLIDGTDYIRGKVTTGGNALLNKARDAQTVVTKIANDVKDNVKPVYDIYVNGDNAPRLTTAGIKSGKYYQKFGKDLTEIEPVKYVEDIKGAVFTLDPSTGIETCVIQLEEINDRGLSAANGVQSNSKASMENRNNIASYARMDSWTATKKLVSLMTRPIRTTMEATDVYLPGENEGEPPRLVMTKWKLMAGMYKDEEGKRIFSIKKVTGNVYDLVGNLVLSAEDLPKAVDVKGRPLSKSYLVRRTRLAKDWLGAVTKYPRKALGAATRFLITDPIRNRTAPTTDKLKSSLSGLLPEGFGFRRNGVRTQDGVVVDERTGKKRKNNALDLEAAQDKAIAERQKASKEAIDKEHAARRVKTEDHPVVSFLKKWGAKLLMIGGPLYALFKDGIMSGVGKLWEGGKWVVDKLGGTIWEAIKWIGTPLLAMKGLKAAAGYGLRKGAEAVGDWIDGDVDVDRRRRNKTKSKGKGRFGRIANAADKLNPMNKGTKAVQRRAEKQAIRYSAAKAGAKFGGKVAGRAGTSLLARAAGRGALGLLGPVGAAIAGVWMAYELGSFIWEYFKSSPNKVDEFRIAAYGINPNHEYRRSRILELEELFSKNTKVDEKTGQITLPEYELGKDEAFTKIMMGFMGGDAGKTTWEGMDEESQAIYAGNLENWMTNRFIPVFYQHAISLAQIDKTLKVHEAFNRIGTGTLKAGLVNSWLKRAYFTYTDENNPYALTVDPFLTDGEEVEGWKVAGPGEVAIYYNNVLKAYQSDEVSLRKADQTRNTGYSPYGIKHKSDFAFETETVRYDRNQPKTNIAGSVPAHELAQQKLVLNKDGSRANTVVIGGNTYVLDNLEKVNLDGRSVIDDGIAIRMRLYGLTDLLETRVSQLLTLEKHMSQYLKFEGSKTASFSEFDFKRIMSLFGPQFGWFSSNPEDVAKFSNWFKQRFSPIFLGFASLVYQYTQSSEVLAAINKIENADKYNLYIELTRIQGIIDGNTHPIWELPFTPIKGYTVNTDGGTIADNLKNLEQNIESNILTEKDPKTGGVKQTASSAATGIAGMVLGLNNNLPLESGNYNANMANTGIRTGNDRMDTNIGTALGSINNAIGGRTTAAAQAMNSGPLVMSGDPGVLAEVIASHESKGNYNIYNKGSKHGYKRGSMDFSKMTVSDVLRLQTLDPSHPDKLFAVGKYQIIPDVLKEIVRMGILKPTDNFGPESQDKALTYLLGNKRKAIKNFIIGNGSDVGKAIDAAAYEWASLQNQNGKAMYGGVNSKAPTKVSDVKNALIRARASYGELIKQGVSPEEAFLKAVTGKDGGAYKNAAMATDTSSTPQQASGATTASAATTPTYDVSTPEGKLAQAQKNIQDHLNGTGTSSWSGGQSSSSNVVADLDAQRDAQLAAAGVPTAKADSIATTPTSGSGPWSEDSTNKMRMGDPLKTVSQAGGKLGELLAKATPDLVELGKRSLKLNMSDDLGKLPNPGDMQPAYMQLLYAAIGDYVKNKGQGRFGTNQMHRTYEDQVIMLKKHGPYNRATGKGAAQPGKSNHGWGRAIDLNADQTTTDSFMKSGIAQKWGFFRPLWKPESGKGSEWWHIENKFVGKPTNKKNGDSMGDAQTSATAPANTDTSVGNNGMPTAANSGVYNPLETAANNGTYNNQTISSAPPSVNVPKVSSNTYSEIATFGGEQSVGGFGSSVLPSLSDGNIGNSIKQNTNTMQTYFDKQGLQLESQQKLHQEQNKQLTDEMTNLMKEQLSVMKESKDTLVKLYEHFKNKGKEEVSAGNSKSSNDQGHWYPIPDGYQNKSRHQIPGSKPAVVGMGVGR